MRNHSPHAGYGISVESADDILLARAVLACCRVLEMLLMLMVLHRHYQRHFHTRKGKPLIALVACQYGACSIFILHSVHFCQIHRSTCPESRCALGLVAFKGIMDAAAINTILSERFRDAVAFLARNSLITMLCTVLIYEACIWINAFRYCLGKTESSTGNRSLRIRGNIASISPSVTDVANVAEECIFFQ